jgi:hypothetical protein
MREMALLGIKQIFTSYHNPKGNAKALRVMRTIKEELIWLNESLGVLKKPEKI